MNQDYNKMKIAIRYWLLGRGYHKAVKAMNFAEKIHCGKRKDGSPEFSHQVSQANYLKTIIDSILFPEETFCVVFLHDTPEDYPETESQLEPMFGKMVADAAIRISKVRKGLRIPDEIYYAEMSECPICSIDKGLDRNHNISSMLGGFTLEKRKEYVIETREKVIPLLKKGRRLFPEQDAAYENIKFSLEAQLVLYDSLHISQSGSLKPEKKK